MVLDESIPKLPRAFKLSTLGSCSFRKRLCLLAEGSTTILAHFNRDHSDISMLSYPRCHLNILCLQSGAFRIFNHIFFFINCNWVVTRWQRLFYTYKNMKLVTTKFKSGGLHEKHVMVTWNLGNHLSICF